LVEEGAPAPVTKPAPLSLARTADDAVFGAESPSVQGAADYWASVLEVRARLGPEVPVWRRWLAPFNPASLRRS
jgi:hypothetical protein